jgi:hypothetical protein
MLMVVTNQVEVLRFVKDLKHLLSLLFQRKTSFLRLNQNKTTSIKLHFMETQFTKAMDRFGTPLG